jgi:hypothetical protein
MPLSEQHKQELRALVPIDRGDKPRLIEIIGEYRRILVRELRRARTPAERDAARDRYVSVLGEVDIATDNGSTPVSSCYRNYCNCLTNPQGHDCKAELATCLDNAALAAPQGVPDNEGILPLADDAPTQSS